MAVEAWECVCLGEPWWEPYSSSEVDVQSEPCCRRRVLGEEYRALPGRALLKGWRAAVAVAAAFLAAARASAMVGLRPAQYNSTLRPEKPVRVAAASESLGPVKEPARFRGMARMSRRDSFLA